MEYIRHTPHLHERRGETESHFLFWCPGCHETHHFTLSATRGWKFDGNYASPTFSPSLLYPDKKVRCHLFLKAGFVEFCSDCGHPLAGKRVPLPNLDEELGS